MTKSIRYILFSLCVAAVGCGDDGTSITEFEGYGVGMPGALLAEGGEALLEKVYWSPSIAQAEAPVEINQFHAYHFTGAFMGATDGPVAGQCNKVTADFFGVHDLPGDMMEYTDFGASVTLNGAGIGASGIAIDKVVAGAEGLGDNSFSPWRLHDEGNFIYGGPEWEFHPENYDTAADFQDVDLVPGGEYSLNIQNDAGEDVTFNLARSYDFPLNAGVEDFEIPATAPEGGFVVSWPEMLNPNTPHSRTHDFAFVALAGFEDPTNIWLCPTGDTEDGSVTIPQSVLDDIEEFGVFQAGRLTHYMDAVDGRRFDLFTIWCSLSVYHKTDGE